MWNGIPSQIRNLYSTGELKRELIKMEYFNETIGFSQKLIIVNRYTVCVKYIPFGEYFLSFCIKMIKYSFVYIL